MRDSVVQYNELAAFGCSDRAALLAEKVLSDVPEFPWAGEAGNRCAPCNWTDIAISIFEKRMLQR